MHYRILTSAKSPGISGGLTYESSENLQPGTPVQVPLRNGSTDGIVLDCSPNKKVDFDMKSIQSVMSTNPLLPAHLIQLTEWMAEYYACSLRNAIRPLLPGKAFKDLLQDVIVGYRLAEDIKIDTFKGKSQRKALELLTNIPWLAKEQLVIEHGISTNTIRNLMKLGAVIEESKTAATKTTTCTPASPSLTDDQQNAFTEILNDNRPSLLFGVTGSGKTEVYAALIAQAIESGKSAICLVPEILLTQPIIDRLSSVVPESHIAVLHSRMTPAAKRKQWKRIRYEDVRLVIGSRSALFAPLSNLGLVIIDEEHEWTYKNEQTPRYHARETAEKLCSLTGAKLVLGSATPSLEAWHRATSSTYHMAKLEKRYQDAAMPKVTVVDLCNVRFGNYYPFSQTLIDAIANRLQNNEQSVLFLNRRGFASAILCTDCKRRLLSQDSGLPLTMHQKRDGGGFLVDHVTGVMCDIPASCPDCGSTNLRPIGAGTQKIEQIVRELFPQANVLRADKDTLESPEDMKHLLESMHSGKGDILLGTQSVAKGLDLPNVTLAAVLIADIGLSIPHFRAGERAFQHLVQLTGRSGRSKPGEVIVQTFRPEAEEVKLATFHETEQYLNQELHNRSSMNYPPCSEMIRCITRHPDAKHKAETLYTTLKSKCNDCSISKAPTFYGGGSEWHVLIRGSNARSAIAHIDRSLCVIDVDPISCV